MLFGEGWTSEKVIRNYPRLTPQALQAVFAYAADAVRLLPPLSEPDPE